MLDELLKDPKALALSVLLHLIIIVAIVINFEFFDKPKLTQMGSQVKTIQAKVIDSKYFEESKNKKKAEQRIKDLEKVMLEKKMVELKKKKEKKKKAAIKKKKNDKAKEKLKAQKKAEVKAQAKKKEKDRERVKAAKKKKQVAEKKKQAAEKRRKAEQDKKRKEAELKSQLEAKESSRRLSSLKEAYSAAIRQKVERNWLRPQESVKIESCEVRVLQGPGGIILDVTFGACNGGTNAYRASIENAVYKSEPLPKPGDRALFEREINFIFSPK